jgi:rubrerythrin
MKSYDYAMQLEKDGEKLYLEAANSTASPGLSSILIMLAAAERMHHAVFERMKKNEPVTVADTAIFTVAKNVFARMRKEEGWNGINISEIGLYRKAQEIEKAAETFYLQKVEQLKGQPQERIFRQIAEEERQHFFLLQNIIDFVSRPEKWLENAEWHHLDEYRSSYGLPALRVSARPDV